MLDLIELIIEHSKQQDCRINKQYRILNKTELIAGVSVNVVDLSSTELFLSFKNVLYDLTITECEDNIELRLLVHDTGRKTYENLNKNTDFKHVSEIYKYIQTTKKEHNNYNTLNDFVLYTLLFSDFSDFYYSKRVDTVNVVRMYSNTDSINYNMYGNTVKNYDGEELYSFGAESTNETRNSMVKVLSILKQLLRVG